MYNKMSSSRKTKSPSYLPQEFFEYEFRNEDFSKLNRKLSPSLGFTPILEKFGNMKTPSNVEKYKMDNYQISNFNPLIYQSFLKESKNVCIYPNGLNIIMFERSNYSTEKFNEAAFRQEYLDAVKEINSIESISVRTRLNNKKIINRLVRRNIYFGNNKSRNKKFRESCDKDVIIFQVTISYIDITNDKYKIEVSNTGHAVILIVDRRANRSYYIDPDSKGRISRYLEYNKYVTLKLEKLSDRILNQFYPVEYVDMLCPQAIEAGPNCVYWSMFLTDAIIKAYERTTKKIVDPQKVISDVMKKYNTKVKLKNLIRSYINYIFSEAQEIEESLQLRYKGLK